MKKLLAWLVARLKERSTWIGLVSVLTSLGVIIDPSLLEYIITAGTALAGIIFVLTSDKKETPPEIESEDVPEPVSKVKKSLK